MMQIKNIVNRFNSLKYYLLLANVVLAVALIILSNLNILPIKNIGDFLFIALVIFLFTLYRPGWGFLFFTGTIALETINLAPEDLGSAIRPYQLIGFFTFLAVVIRYSTHRLNFSLPKFRWMDYVAALLVVSGFLSSLDAPDTFLATKQAMIICSFALLYFLVRIFVQDLEDVKRIAPFFFSSAGVVLVYGIWQNVVYKNGGNSFEVMPGRVNATFSEPDWYGIFLVFLLSVLYVFVYKLNEKIKIFCIKRNKTNFVFYLLIWTLIILAGMNLIMTVSRSAWLGAGVLVVSLLIYLLMKGGKWKLILEIILSILISIGLVYIFKLTDFELKNRLQSTASGKQEITISCERETELPEVIDDMSVLDSYGCRHINLEEIENEISQGKFVGKIYRQDPNVNIRSEIYQKSWQTLKSNWFLGIGWGNISGVLGQDERGAGLNSSNIFLEAWLGAGIIGLIAFVVLIGQGLVRGKLFFWRKLKEGKFKREDSGMDYYYLFLILSAVAIIVPNLFNAGVMLGFLWLWFGLSFIKK